MCVSCSSRWAIEEVCHRVATQTIFLSVPCFVELCIEFICYTRSYAMLALMALGHSFSWLASREE
jgi:hypothetical protein